MSKVSQNDSIMHEQDICNIFTFPKPYYMFKYRFLTRKNTCTLFFLFKSDK